MFLKWVKWPMFWARDEAGTASRISVNRSRLWQTLGFLKELNPHGFFFVFFFWGGALFLPEDFHSKVTVTRPRPISLWGMPDSNSGPLPEKSSKSMSRLASHTSDFVESLPSVSVWRETTDQETLDLILEELGKFALYLCQCCRFICPIQYISKFRFDYTVWLCKKLW